MIVAELRYCLYRMKSVMLGVVLVNETITDSVYIGVGVVIDIEWNWPEVEAVLLAKTNISDTYLDGCFVVVT